MDLTDKSVAWLLITSGVSLVMGSVSSVITYRVKRKELIETREIDDERQKQDRLRREVLRWANPVLGSVRDLKFQISNVVAHTGYVAMAPGFQGNSNWPISYEYSMTSLLFLFSQYFAWIRMLEEEFSFEFFQSQSEKDRFFAAIHGVRRALSTWPPPYNCEGKDTQVFALQQRYLGELLIVRDAQGRRCMSYAEFVERMRDQQFKNQFQPLIVLLDDIAPKEDCRWKRLQATRDALIELETVCEELIKVQ